MKNLFRVAFILMLSIAPYSLQSQTKNAASHMKPRHGLGMVSSESSKTTIPEVKDNNSFPADPLSSLITVPGATPLGISGKWYLQGVHGLHNVQVDPDNPMNVHAVVMTALNVTTDTSTANFFPTRNVYYTFSADGGATWKTPKALGTTRAGYPDMILYKRNGVYVPVIADHHFASASVTDLFCSIYVESGNPGDGNFKIGNCDRTTFSSAAHDIIWPIIAASNDGKKLYIIASVSPPSTNSSAYDYIQFGSFDLDPQTGAPSNWSSWQAGPGANSSPGLAIGQTYSLRISPSGKMGIVWQSYDLQTPDFGLYLGESTDNGTTWTDPVSVFSTVTSTLPAITDPNFKGDPTIYLQAGEGIDMYYDKEVATVIFAGEFGTLNFQVGDNNSFLPASGTLLMWRNGMATSQILVSQNGGDQTDLPAALDNGAFLSTYVNTSIIDPQNTNLLSPTIALTSNEKIWSIIFEAWVNNDSGQYTRTASDGVSDTTIYLPFHSIYRITTTDNGSSWTSAPEITNDISLPTAKHNDYRFPEASTWNPLTGGVTNYTLFDADTAAGNWFNPGEPGFDDVSWFFKKDALGVNGVKASAAQEVLSLNQNYPNPFIASTTIPVVMKDDDMVTLSVADILGREVAIVYHGRLSAGEHNIPFSAPNLGAGIYTYTLKTSTGSVSRTMSLIK